MLNKRKQKENFEKFFDLQTDEFIESFIKKKYGKAKTISLKGVVDGLNHYSNFIGNIVKINRHSKETEIFYGSCIVWSNRKYVLNTVGLSSFAKIIN